MAKAERDGVFGQRYWCRRTGAIGDPYEDASGNKYLPMFGQPVMVFSGDAAGLASVLDRAKARGVQASIFTHALFSTGNDVDNRAAVRRVLYDDLDLVGLAFHADRRIADKILKGLALHR